MTYLCGMKHRLTTLILALMAACQVAAQTITGIVTDGRQPLTGANVFVMGTIDGCLTDTLGRFSFTTARTGEVTLKVTYMGYDDHAMTADVAKMNGLAIVMRERATPIDEVVVTASSFNFGKGASCQTMDALDVVLTGSSCGDIVGALQTLPGTQKVGEDGKLYVRGGDSEECQTFVNRMHVLMPYSTNTENNAVRGRFSPFLFKGVNFSTGGYDGEYGQALSSILPMETTDMASSDKYGVSASLVDWNVGGTKTFDHGSLSANAALTSMQLYNRLFPDRNDYTRPYRKFSGEMQYKREFSTSSVMKTYAGYDLTSVGQVMEGRRLSLREHNIYANITTTKTFPKGGRLFLGAANSSVLSDIDDARVPGDHYHHFRNEVHLKAEAGKVLSRDWRMSVGVEDYLRNSRMRYDSLRCPMQYNILAVHADTQWRIINQLFAHLSARAEMMKTHWLLMPRATLSYIPDKHLQLSLVAGRYSQAAADEYMMQGGNELRQATADHLILSLQYKTKGTLLRIEPYWKRYRNLPLWENGLYQPHGHGMSRGVDVFVENHTLVKGLSTIVSYSLNASKRRYHDYDRMRTPEYVSRHNLRVTAKYAIGKTILSLTESYASSRHFPLADTPHYNSVDACVTQLVHPKVIVYASLSNILGRNNIFGYDSKCLPVTASYNRFLYIGIFVSLKNTKAYDISNF